MTETIDQIPLPLSLLNDPIKSDIAYEAWERTDTLVFGNPKTPVSWRIRSLYCLGYYKAQVYNGGHSQLFFNMDRGETRSPFLVNGFIKGVRMIGASEFAAIGEDFAKWIDEYPVLAARQTGFEGGRAEFLDDLDERFSELNEGMRSRLIAFEASSNDPHEANFLRECIERTGNWSGDLDALEIVCLLRSDLILGVPDEAYEAIWNALLR